MFLLNFFPKFSQDKKMKCKTNGGAIVSIIHFLLDLIE